jgi:hypothetical protein
MERDKMTEKIVVRCTPELKEEIWQEAKRRRLTPANLVRMVLSDLVTPKPKVDPRRPMRDV